MKIRREPAVLAATAAIVGLLAWGLVSDAGERIAAPRWSSQGIDVPDLRVPDIAKIPMPKRPSSTEVPRDLFAEPRDSRPLPTLRLREELPEPPLDPLAWLSPPPSPGPGSSKWHVFLRVPAIPKEPPPEPAAAADDADADGGAASEPASAPAPPPRKPPREVLEKRYDRVTFRDGMERWGRILNPPGKSRFDLGPDDPVLFQEYDVEKDVPTFKHDRTPRSEVTAFDFAKTIANDLEMRRRKVALIKGNEAKIRDLALWCLEHGPEHAPCFEEAGKLLTKVLEFDPSDPANSLAMGRYCEETFRYQDAWKLYRSMTEGSHRANAEAWVALARLAMKLRLDRDAVDYLRRASEIDPGSYRPKLALGEGLLSVHRFDEALTALESAMAVEPRDVATRAEIRARVGDVRLAKGDLKGAEAAYRLALEAQPDQADASAGLAVVRLCEKKPADARAQVAPALAASPSASALVIRGLAAFGLGELASARSDFDAAVGIDPVRDVAPLAALAFLRLATGRVDEAKAAVEVALRNDPGDPYALYLKGRIHRELGQNDVAREALHAASMTDLGFVEPLIELGMIAAAEDLPDSADRYFARAAELDAGSAEVRAVQGRNLLLAGQTRRARDAFKAAVAIASEQPVALVGLALCDYLEGDSTGAKTGLRHVIDTRPQGDPHRTYSEQTLQRILDHEKKEEWWDVFDRQALRQDWVPTPSPKVEVNIVAGEARLAGDFDQTGEAELKRYLFSRQFRDVEFDVTIGAQGGSNGDGHVPSKNDAELKVFVRDEPGRSGKNKFEVNVVRQRDGTVAVVAKESEDQDPKLEKVDFSWPDGKTVRVRIERSDDDANPRGRIVLDDEVVRDDIKFPRGSSGKLQVGVSAKGSAGHKALVAVDNVRIVQVRE